MPRPSGDTEIHSFARELLRVCLRSSTPFTCLVQELTRLSRTGEWQQNDLHSLAKDVFRLLSHQAGTTYSAEWA